MKWAWIAAFSLLVCHAADLDRVKSQADPEKRSDMALDYAISTLAAARDAYSAGDYRNSLQNVNLVAASVDLAYESLKESGKSPRRSKYYKRAEMKSRAIFRRLDDFAREVAVDDRPAIEKASRRVTQVHDELLTKILEKN